MFRTLFKLPSIVADYTVGTVIVLVQLSLAERAQQSNSLRLRA